MGRRVGLDLMVDGEEPEGEQIALAAANSGT
jgi:hypothetical protein